MGEVVTVQRGAMKGIGELSLEKLTLYEQRTRKKPSDADLGSN